MSNEVIAALIGAAVGAILGYWLQRYWNRAKISISFIDVRYDDTVSLSPDIQQTIGRYGMFIQFIESQVKWSFSQRIIGNLFTVEELRIVRQLAQHFLESQSQLAGRLDRDIGILDTTDNNEMQRLVAELTNDYQGTFHGVLAHDIQNDPAPTRQKMKNLLSNARYSLGIASNWLTAFINEVNELVEGRRRSSDRVMVKVGIANHGIEDGVFHSQALLSLQGGPQFKLLLQIGNRPWEQENSPSEFQIMRPKSFVVVAFIVDELLNAPNDLRMLKSRLTSPTKTAFRLMGVASREVAKKEYTAQLN